MCLGFSRPLYQPPGGPRSGLLFLPASCSFWGDPWNFHQSQASLPSQLHLAPTLALECPLNLPLWGIPVLDLGPAWIPS